MTSSSFYLKMLASYHHFIFFLRIAYDWSCLPTEKATSAFILIWQCSSKQIAYDWTCLLREKESQSLSRYNFQPSYAVASCLLLLEADFKVTNSIGLQKSCAYGDKTNPNTEQPDCNSISFHFNLPLHFPQYDLVILYSRVWHLHSSNCWNDWYVRPSLEHIFPSTRVSAPEAAHLHTGIPSFTLHLWPRYGHVELVHIAAIQQ